MKNPWRSVRALVAAALLLGLPACGAGLITGVAASGGGSESRPPELLLAPVLPLVPAANTTRTVVITNAQLSAAAQVRVRLQALGETVDQLAPQISVQSGSTAITFGVATGLIAKAAVDPSAADVDALLTVLVDGRPIGSTVPVLLVRQPRAELDLAPGTARFVSPFGEAVTVRVGALRDFGSVEMFVATRDPDNAAADGGPATLIRPCTNVEAVPTGTPGEAMVTGTLPGNSFPDQADVFVRDASAGESTAVRVYYEPAITLALPSQGITTGGNLVTLIGTALVPHDFGQMPAPLQFDAVEFAFQKGNRRIELGREDFRAELSAGDRLVFRMPSSPDGRPGQVDIVLRVQLEGVVAEVVASQVFLFASPHPFFGPRGAALDRFPVAVAPIPLDGAPAGGDAPDFAVLSEESGVAYLQLLLAQENGMFLRFGARRRIGDPEVPAERNPADLCSADFDGDDVPDLFVVNSGAAMAVHHIVLGQAKPKTPLGGVFQVPGIGGMAHCRTGRFDGDELEDVLLVPGPAADPQQRPQLLLSRPYFDPSTERVVPAFAQPIDVPVGAMSYQAVEVADLDGDGFLDVAVVDGVQLELDIAYGRGDGTFENAVPLVVTVPGYTPDPGSPAVGLHACGNGPQQSLGLVLGGDNDGVGADPQALVAVLHQSSPRVFGQPLGSDIRGLGSDPVGASVIANIDRTEALELVVGIRNELLTGPAAVAVFYYRGPDFFPLSGGVEVGGEQPRKVRGLHFGRAFAANPSGGGLAVFAVHESDVDGVPERRLSTFLVFDDGVLPTTLLAPDGGRHRDTPIGAIIGGNWSARAVAGHGAVRDLAVVRNDDSTGVPSIEILENDGFGGFPIPGELIAVPGIVPPTLALLPAPEDEIEALVFVDESSRLGFWRPRVAGAFTLTNELRLASPNPELATAMVSPSSVLRVADVDGDGIDDIVALIEFEVPSPGDGDALLVLARGNPAAAVDEQPFFEPTVVALAHGKATSFALGDFAAAVPGQPVQLELALAVPEPAVSNGLDGDHVRFYRYVAGPTPAEDHFEPSHAPNGPQVLLAGSKPTRVAADDFDGDGLVDLMVAAAGDASLRLFRNIALPTPTNGGEVEIDAFQEAESSTRALSPGFPTQLRLGDVNGDGTVDVLVAVESTTSTLGTSLAFYVSEEPGLLGEANFVSPSRLGDREAAMALDLGDYNRDSVLDLFIGWDTAINARDRNVRVLFGGSR